MALMDAIRPRGACSARTARSSSTRARPSSGRRCRAGPRATGTGSPIAHVEGDELGGAAAGPVAALRRGTFVPGWKTVADPQAARQGDLAPRRGEGRRGSCAGDVASRRCRRGDGVAIAAAGMGRRHAPGKPGRRAGAWSHRLARQLGDAHPARDRARLQHDAAARAPSIVQAAADLRRPRLRRHAARDAASASAARSSSAGCQLPPNFTRADAMLREGRRASCRASMTDRRPRSGWGYPPVAAGLAAGDRPRRALAADVVYAFGHGHLGLTQAAATGRLVADLVTGQPGRSTSSPFSPADASDSRSASHGPPHPSSASTATPAAIRCASSPAAARVLEGATMMERRAHFLAEYDWIRTGLMFEPRGHDMMSGSILYPPTRDDCDVAILFIETSGCLPMCGHGTIGTVTMAIEHGLVTPKTPGVLQARHAGRPRRRRVPTGRRVRRGGAHHQRAVLPAFARACTVECPGLGRAHGRRRLWRQFLCDRRRRRRISATWPTSPPASSSRWSPVLRRRAERDATASCIPRTPRSAAVATSCGPARRSMPSANARNAVFYGDKAIDRSPCGTGTSARMAQLDARGKLKVGDAFVHESDHRLAVQRPRRARDAGRRPHGDRSLDRRLGAA